MGNKSYGDAQGGVYEGATARGRRQGHGKHTYLDGSVFVGDWDGNARHGAGQLTKVSGTTYAGWWLEGIFRRGTCTQPSGATYSTEQGGSFRAFKLNGPGRFRSPEGSSFTGDFRNGRFHGRGERTAANGGGSYRGMWAAGLRGGEGVYRWPDGTFWEGRWSGGMPQGVGRMNWPDGVSLRTELASVGVHAPDAPRVSAGHAPFLAPSEEAAAGVSSSSARRAHHRPPAGRAAADSGRRLLFHTLSSESDLGGRSGVNENDEVGGLPPPPAYTASPAMWAL